MPKEIHQVITGHGHKKREKFLSEKSITPGHVG
jgi:hypothetical protein